MKKAPLLLTFLVAVCMQHAVAQNGTVNIPLGALQAAYRTAFGSDPDFQNYGQLALAINRSKSQYFPGSVGGFWNGRITPNPADHSQDMYSIVTIGPGAAKWNPQEVRLRDLRAIFGGAFGRLPDFDSDQDLALAIHRFQGQNSVPCAGGFWNGEQAVIEGHDTFGIVWVASATAPQKILTTQLAASFQARTQRAPDFASFADMAFAVSCWIDDNQPGQALGGFWNGEQAGTGADKAFWIVLVR